MYKKTIQRNGPRPIPSHWYHLLYPFFLIKHYLADWNECIWWEYLKTFGLRNISISTGRYSPLGLLLAFLRSSGSASMDGSFSLPVANILANMIPPKDRPPGITAQKQHINTKVEKPIEYLYGFASCSSIKEKNHLFTFSFLILHML